MKKSKILFVIPSLRIGGIEKSFVNFITNLDIKNSNVDLKILDKDGYETYKNQIPKSVNILPDDSSSEIFKTFKKSVSLLFKNRKILVMLKRILCPLVKIAFNVSGEQIFWSILKNDIIRIDKNYDLAIAYADGKSTYYVMDKIDAKHKIAWVHTDHKEAKYNSKIDRKYFEKFDYIFCVSNFLANQIIKNTSLNNVKVLYNLFIKKEIDNKLNETIEDICDKRAINIVTVGRLSYEKGYDRALYIANELNKKNINFKWFFVGEGNYRKKINKIISKYNLYDKVVLLGKKENPYPYINKCDIYVQLSRYEGFSTTILEALYIKKFVITTNVSGVEEQIVNGKNGIILEEWKSAVDSIIAYDNKFTIIENEEIFGNNTINSFLDILKRIKIYL